MPKPIFAQNIAINEGIGAGFPYTFTFPFDDVGSAFRGQPANIETGFINLIRTTGPNFSGKRIRNSRAYGSIRVEDTTP